MTDKIRCPYCGQILLTKTFFYAPHMLYCPNALCVMRGVLPITVWRDLAYAKHVRQQINRIKDRHAKELNAKIKDIDRCEARLSLRDQELGNCQKQLKKAQDALTIATDFIEDIAYCNSKIRAVHFSGASASWIKAAQDKLDEITSITKQDNE